MSKELKPCPFCGKLGSVRMETSTGSDDRQWFYVLCAIRKEGCGASSGWYRHDQDAINNWNRREGGFHYYGKTAIYPADEAKSVTWGTVYTAICETLRNAGVLQVRQRKLLANRGQRLLVSWLIKATEFEEGEVEPDDAGFAEDFTDE